MVDEMDVIAPPVSGSKRTSVGVLVSVIWRSWGFVVFGLAKCEGEMNPPGHSGAVSASFVTTAASEPCWCKTSMVDVMSKEGRVTYGVRASGYTKRKGLMRQWSFYQVLLNHCTCQRSRNNVEPSGF